ncbi:UNVERIFIED_CONTAM: hypothetical protein FKN15_076621 [Acipenser sinensis]
MQWLRNGARLPAGFVIDVSPAVSQTQLSHVTVSAFMTLSQEPLSHYYKLICSVQVVSYC